MPVDPIKPRVKTKSPAATATGDLAARETQARSVADVEGLQAVAVRGGDAARHIASVIDIAAADVADMEAAEVVKAATAPTATPSLGGSRRRGQRHRAEGSCGNKCEREFA